jgi:hypothetical protein
MYPAYDIVVVGQMSFAVFAAVDFVAVEIDVICETHDGLLDASSRCWSCGVLRRNLLKLV